MIFFEVEDLFTILSKEGTIDDFLSFHKTITRKEVDDFLDGVVIALKQKIQKKI